MGIMEDMLDRIDAGAGSDELVKTVTQGDLGRWFDEAEKLRFALAEIRGWREIGSADTPREKLTAIEKICDDALAQ